MKIQDLNSNDSLFIELDSNEAADVGGGSLYGPNADRINLLLDQGFELSDIVASAGNNPSLMFAQFQDHVYLS
jgi:hypothetical protein